MNDLKQEESTKLAKTKADELAKRVKAGEKFDAAAKALGLEAKTSELISRNDSIPSAASGKQLGEAFQMKQGDVGAPLSHGNELDGVSGGGERGTKSRGFRETEEEL